MIVWIVGIVMVAHVIERTLKHRADLRKKADLDGDAQQRFQELEERIRVLERIVTENKFDLKNEIDRL
jgi:FixJ family two-component response regulator